MPNSAFASPLNVASIKVTSGRIGSIEGYHDATLSGPITISGTIAVNRIAPVIDSAFAFDDAAGAYRHLQAARHFGKVVIDVA